MNDIEQFTNILNTMEFEFKMEMKYEKAELIASRNKEEHGGKTFLIIQLMDDLKRSFLITDRPGKNHVKKISPEWIEKQYHELILDEYTQNGGMEYLGFTKFNYGNGRADFEMKLENDVIMRVKRLFLRKAHSKESFNGVIVDLLKESPHSFKAISDNIKEATLDFFALRYKNKSISEMAFLSSTIRDKLVGRIPKIKFDYPI